MLDHLELCVGGGVELVVHLVAQRGSVVHEAAEPLGNVDTEVLRQSEVITVIT